MNKNQKQLVYWITERESIRKKKEAAGYGPWSDKRVKKDTTLSPPWSDNKVMQDTYFCNVNREDDKVTRWIRDFWNYGASVNEWGDDRICIEAYDFAMIVARIFNLPSTLAILDLPEDGRLSAWVKRAERILYEMEKEGENIWTGAYIVATAGKTVGKIPYCIKIFKKIAASPKITHGCSTLQEAYLALRKVDGLGSFMAAQVVADLKNTKGHPLQKAKDWKTFSAPGNGSLRGLTWFFEEKITPTNYHAKIKEAYEIIESELSESILEILCFQNLQNCFSEYDKFMRVTNGTGHIKRKYKWRKK